MAYRDGAVLLLPFRILGVLIRLGLLAVLVLAGFVAWAEFWPAPHRPRPERCPPRLRACIVASGRVLYHTTFAPGRDAHVVLMSRSSATLPGVVWAEFPRAITRAPAGLGFGDWVSVSGRRTTGSHVEHGIRIEGFATSRGRTGCGRSSTGSETCHRVR